MELQAVEVTDGARLAGEEADSASPAKILNPVSIVYILLAATTQLAWIGVIVWVISLFR